MRAADPSAATRCGPWSAIRTKPPRCPTIGVELVKGDIRDADDVLRAAKGAEAAIHCAALLGGASQDLEDFKAVNMVGTTNVLDAGKPTACAGWWP